MGKEGVCGWVGVCWVCVGRALYTRGGKRGGGEAKPGSAAGQEGNTRVVEERGRDEKLERGCSESAGLRVWKGRGLGVGRDQPKVEIRGSGL